MKFLNLLLLSSMVLLSPLAMADEHSIAIEDVVGLVSAQNLSVLQNAERVYQSRDAIQVARGNLLPKLNLWKMVGAAVDPRSALGLIEDIVPFLVPANWWQVKQSKLFAGAQREAYVAIWANEVMTAKALFIHAQLDQALLDHVRRRTTDLGRLKTIARSREVLGGSPESLSKQIEIQILSLSEDERTLRYLVKDELTLLAVGLGLPADTQLILKPLSSDLKSEIDREESTLADQSVRESPELRQFDAMIEAARYAKKSARFTFLGVSSLSRGVMGGAFDSLPISSGLGFGTAPSVRVTQREKSILELQRKAASEGIRRTAILTLAQLRLDRESIVASRKRAELSSSLRKSLEDRLRMGEAIEAFELVNASKAEIDAEAALLSLRFRFLTNLDRIDRLTFEGDYRSLPKLEMN